MVTHSDISLGLSSQILGRISKGRQGGSGRRKENIEVLERQISDIITVN